MKSEPKKEIDIARTVIDWLEGWDIYQEVQVFSGGNRADIIAVQGNIVWTIEVKLSLSLCLLSQASRWTKLSHFVSVAVPRGRNRKDSAAAEYLRWKGIGYLCVTDGIREQIKPRLNRKAVAYHIKNALCEQHKTFALAGNADGNYWTPYQETCRRILAKVKKNPGLTMKELIDGLKHHYASSQSARCAIPKWADMGKIPGVELRRDGRFLKFYPRESADDVKTRY